MNQLIVVAFDRFDDAKTAMASLRSLEAQGRISFEDTATVQRDPDGKAHVRNEVSGTTETATAVGAVIGGILTFAVPLLGAAVGAAAWPWSGSCSIVARAARSSTRSRRRSGRAGRRCSSLSARPMRTRPSPRCVRTAAT